ncbi:MFS transporter [Nocardioides ginsengisoli]
MNHTTSPQSAARTRAGVTLALVVGAVGIYKAIESMTSPALPILQEELNASRAEIAWVLTGVLLTGPVVTPVIGRLGDLYDKRRVLLGVLCIVGAGTLLSALSVSMPMLIAGQLLQGVGLGTVPLAVGIMRDTQSASRLKFGNGLMVGVIFACTALAMLVAGPIADRLDYHWLFWMPFAVLVVAIVAAWVLVPSCPSNSSGRHVDLLGAALFGGSLATLLIGFTYAPEWGWTSYRFVALVVGSVVLFAIFVAVELRSVDPLVDVRILASHEVIVASGLMVMAGFTINLFFVMIPMQVQQPASTGYGFGASGTTTSAILVPGVLMGALAPVAGWIEARVGRRAAAAIPPILTAASFLLMIASPGALPLVVAAMLVCGFSTGIGITQAMNIIATSVPEDRVSAFSGMNFVVKAVGSTSGVQIAASILSTDAASAHDAPAWSAFLTVFAVGVGLATAALLLVLTLRPSRDAGAGAPSPAEPVEATV